MKLSLLIVATALGLSAPSFAQNAPPPGAEPDPGAALRAACRQQMRTAGMRELDEVRAVSACVVRQRPALAQREQCRVNAFSRGVRVNEVHAFVENCLRGRT